MNSQQTTIETVRSDRNILHLLGYRDLRFLFLSSLLLPFLLLLPIPILRVPLGLVGVFFLPGNALMKAAFPYKKDMDRYDRLALSFALSVALIPVLVLLINVLPWGIRPWPIAITLSITILIFTSIAAVRRFTSYDYPQNDLSLSPSVAVKRKPSNRSKWGYLVGGLALISLILASGMIILKPDSSQGWTEFYILGTNGMADNFPRQVAPGQPINLHFGITNHEVADTIYRVEVRSQGYILAKTGSILVKQGDDRENTLSFALPQAGDNQQVDILLFRNNEVASYRSLRLWINVSEKP